MTFIDHNIGPSSIRLRRSSTPGDVPTSAMLRPGELAVNTADGRIFIGSDDGVKTIGEDNQIVSSGGISDLTSAQQEDIKTGTIVTTTDGKRWVYKGTGSKTQQGSYIELADITPVWSAIADKPSTFTPSAHTHAISEVTSLQDSLNSKVSSAPNWSTNHTESGGNAYQVGDLVYHEGNIYRAIATNDSIEVGNTSYWTLVGAGYRHNIAIQDVSNYFLPPSSANDGDVLTYDTDTASWIAAAATGGGIAPPSSPNEGDVLTYNTGAWVAAAPTGGIPAPVTQNDGDVLTYSSGSSAWIAAAPTGIPAPGSPNTNDILSWNGSSWVAVSPSTPGLPAASTYDLLVYDGTNWVSEPLYGGSYSPLASGASGGDVLKWDNGTSDWLSAQIIPDYASNVSYAQGDLVAYQNTIWKATTGGMGNDPSYGSGYWSNLSIIDNSPIPSPATANNGDVLTYNGSNSTWEAAAPSGGGSTPEYVRLSSAETRTTAGGSPTATGLTLVVQGNTSYIVEGLAYFSTETDAGSIDFGLQLSATTSDGNIWLDIDNFLDLDPEVVKAVSFITDQTIYSVVTGFPSGNMGSQFAVRFRALVEVGAISSTNITGMFGVTSVDANVTIEPGSWMSARVVTT